jgi:glycosyltransferase involved in cell wall biosynthesis
LSKFAAVDVFPLPQRHSRVRYGWDHFRSIARGRAYTEYLYESRAFRRQLTAVVESTTFDLVHADSLDMAGYFAACGDTPIVCVHHDVESALLDRRAAVERSGWRAAYLRYQARLTRRLERHWCGRVALNVAVSELDRILLKQLVPAARVAVVPNGVDTDEFRPVDTGGAGAAFIGGTGWFPNLDALEFFAGQIWPHLRAAAPGVRVRWVGQATAEQQREYGERHGIELTGYVGDVKPFMCEAACHIVPLRAGGGTRLKILNSWAMGKPVVSTSIGCEGLAAIDGDNILIRDDPKEFAAAVVSLLANSAMRRRLSERGRATVERLYSWDIIAGGMIETYLNVARLRTRDHRVACGAGCAEPRYIDR